MKRVLLAIGVAALVVGCAQSYSPGGSGAGVLVNTSGTSFLYDSTNSLVLNFTALGTPITVTVLQATATAATTYTATPGGGCNGVAAVQGSTTPTTSAGPTGSFMVTALLLAQGCVIAISSSTAGPGANVTVNTAMIPTAPPTNIPITSKGRNAGS